MSTPGQANTGTRVLARSSILNLIGQAAPLAVALFAIRILIPAMGRAEFGILTLGWTIIGYFSLFDLGLGRTLTHAISTRLGTETERELPEVVWTGLAMLLLAGTVGALVLVLGAPLLTSWLDIPAELRADSLTTFYLLALGIPFTVLTSGLRGIFEATQDFGIATALKLPFGVFTFVGPLLVLPYSHRLVPIIGALVAGRIMGFVAHFAVCLLRYSFLRQRIRLEPRVVAPLIRMGGWMTVSNVISPLMSDLDRFLIGRFFPIAILPFYTTPYDAVTNLFLIPGSIMSVLFPALATSFATDRARARELIHQGLRLLSALLFPLVLIGVMVGPAMLALWLGPEFGRRGGPILQWIAVGILINGPGQVAYTALQAIGRADLTGKLHIFELPLYAAAIWWLAHTYGLVGVAIAWVLRITLDSVLLVALIGIRLPETRGDLAESMLLLCALLAVLSGGAMVPSLGARIAVLVAILLVFPPLVWAKVASKDERTALRSWITAATQEAA